MDEDEFNRLLRTESVFKNQKSLEQAWVPDKDQKLLCRDQEIKRLGALHRPILETKGEYSINTLVVGTGGIGKTVTIKYFVGRFKDAVLKQDFRIVVEYYDCLQHRTKSGILRDISSKLHYNAGHGYSDNEIMVQILKEIKKQNTYLFIILDEVHNLPQEDIMALLNSSIGYGGANSRFSIICVTRPADWYKVENEKISSRIQETIKMQAYSKVEAFDILKYRRNLAFRDGVLEDAEVDLLAEIVAETKNMRVGIDIMRACGIHCNENNLRQIKADMILTARGEVSSTFRPDIIDGLKEHEQYTLLAIARTLKQNNEPDTGVDESYENYAVVCEEYGVKPHVKMSYRKYIRNLHDAKAINVDYLNPTVDKKGRQIEIRLTDIPAEQLMEYLTKKIPRSQ